MFCLMRYLKQIIDSFITFPICICCRFDDLLKNCKKKLQHKSRCVHFIAYEELAKYYKVNEPREYLELKEMMTLTHIISKYLNLFNKKRSLTIFR